MDDVAPVSDPNRGMVFERDGFLSPPKENDDAMPDMTELWPFVLGLKPEGDDD